MSCIFFCKFSSYFLLSYSVQTFTFLKVYEIPEESTGAGLTDRSYCDWMHRKNYILHRGEPVRSHTNVLYVRYYCKYNQVLECRQGAAFLANISHVQGSRKYTQRQLTTGTAEQFRKYNAGGFCGHLF